MTSARKQRLMSAALGTGLAFGLGAPAWAQITSGPGLGSGSGSGTGTGSAVPGLGGTGTGSESGRLGSTGTGASGPGRLGSGVRPGLGPMPSGDTPGALESLRDPSLGVPQSGLMLGRSDVERITAELYDRARDLTDPVQRSEALERAARTHIHIASDVRTRDEFKTLDEARAALAESWAATRLVDDRILHDNRCVSLVDTLILLGAAYRDLGLVVNAPAFPLDAQPSSSYTAEDRLRALDGGLDAFDRAAAVAGQIRDPNYRSETIYSVAESEARSAAQIALARLSTERESLGNPAPLPTAGQRSAADRVFEAAGRHAQTIGRPVWRDRALLMVSNQAAAANRFAQSLEVARRIGQPVVRADALVRIAESEARRPDMAASATDVYQEAARSVASIPNEDPRAILADVLIRSLMLSGRFEDARLSVSLFEDADRRYEALALIAEHMGRRGLDRAAREWIAQTLPPDRQSYVLRRMTDGMIASVEQYRTGVMANGPDGFGSSGSPGVDPVPRP